MSPQFSCPLSQGGTQGQPGHLQVPPSQVTLSGPPWHLPNTPVGEFLSMPPRSTVSVSQALRMLNFSVGGKVLMPPEWLALATLLPTVRGLPGPRIFIQLSNFCQSPRCQVISHCFPPIFYHEKFQTYRKVTGNFMVDSHIAVVLTSIFLSTSDFEHIFLCLSLFWVS